MTTMTPAAATLRTAPRPRTAVPGTGSPGDLERDWQAWRAARHAALRDPRGPLSIVAHHWLPPEPTALAGVPGLWWADRHSTHVTVGDPGGGPVLLDAETSRPVTGTRRVVVAEAGSASPFLVAPDGTGTPDDPSGLVAVEVALRTGRALVRLRDPGSDALAAATDRDPVETYPFDAAAVVDVGVRWYDVPRPATVGAAKPGLVHHVEVVGSVDLAGPDGPVTLEVVRGHRGGVTLAFTDTADDVPGWRAVHLTAAALLAERSTGRLRIDLNRASAYPSHFNDHGTCPRPLEGNALPFPVVAGEKDPR
ncbi:DUF1684 domain-containing protein [Luteimicrobium subarcticum]|uniref:DUF1684 domain-containing protein n=1 Tax=Luteimicrobium subarcticum TaxID=620910 RepID=A0A2M8WSA6_9MICO|nr:DUF1684 domain-containing protein [Luteimicrobium subarcticum]PJI93821.1 hypothetical protein CLV34_1297 [Luteimicrobium subarcticum]